MKIGKIKTSGGEAWLEDGIYCMSRNEGVMGTLEMAREDLKIHIELGGGKKRPQFADLRGMKGATPEQRDYVNDEEIKRTYSAGAILIGSIFSRIMASQFMNVKNPPFPVKLFTTKKEAFEWLQQFK